MAHLDSISSKKQRITYVRRRLLSRWFEKLLLLFVLWKKKATTASVICYQPQQLFLLSIIHAGPDLSAAKNTKCYRSTIYFHFNRFYLWTEQVIQSQKKEKIDEKSFCYVISMLGEEIIIKVLAPSVFKAFMEIIAFCLCNAIFLVIINYPLDSRLISGWQLSNSIK